MKQSLTNIYTEYSLFEKVILAHPLKELLYFTIKSLVATTGTVQVEQKFLHFVHTVYLCVPIKSVNKQKHFFLHYIKRLSFIMKAHGVLCEVATEFHYKTLCTPGVIA